MTIKSTGRSSTAKESSPPQNSLPPPRSASPLPTAPASKKRRLATKRLVWLTIFVAIISVGLALSQRAQLSGLTDEEIFAKLMAELPAAPFEQAREFLTSKSFAPGRTVKQEIEHGGQRRNSVKQERDGGRESMDAVILIPGIISSGLESWSTDAEQASYFREKLWGGTSMLRILVSNQANWIKAMSLDLETGLDPKGYKLRAVQGFDGASAFMPGYWLWEKIIENLAVLDYDNEDLALFSYDWRLSFGNLEVRDSYFSNLKNRIEFSKRNLGKKTTLVAHSMGSLVVLYFFKWVELESNDDRWVENHISNFINVAGTLLGVAKSTSALISGEFKDTVELNPALVWTVEKLFSKADRARLFQSWGGASSMILKGGDSVWGDTGISAPDDVGSNSYSHLLRFSQGSGLTSGNLTLDQSLDFLLSNTPASYRTMLLSNYSLGMERDEAVLAANRLDPRTWSNPLQSQLPFAPSLTIYSMYGVFDEKSTERGYYYRRDPNSNRTEIDGSITDAKRNTRSGIIFGEGDGTVSLLSLGAMYEGWKLRRYNPSGCRIITHELLDTPNKLELRGVGSADHVDILGNSELIKNILRIVSNGAPVEDRFYSNIRDYAKKIRWD